jgi:phage/plasmid-associated DNA primase
LDRERRGILAWIIEGAVAWHQRVLGAPDNVRSATAGYRTAMDDLADFLADRCVREPGATVGSRALYEAYKGWSEGAGERPLSEKMFSTRVVERGFTKDRNKTTRYFAGLRLRTPLDDEFGDDGSDRVTGCDAISGIAGNVRSSHVETPENPSQPVTTRR